MARMGCRVGSSLHVHACPERLKRTPRPPGRAAQAVERPDQGGARSEPLAGDSQGCAEERRDDLEVLVVAKEVRSWQASRAEIEQQVHGAPCDEETHELRF